MTHVGQEEALCPIGMVCPVPLNLQGRHGFLLDAPGLLFKFQFLCGDGCLENVEQKRQTENGDH